MEREPSLSRITVRLLAILLFLTLLPAGATTPEPEPDPAPQPAQPPAEPPGPCGKQPLVTADVVVLDQPIDLNRSGASIPGGMIYALKLDVESSDTPPKNCAADGVECKAGEVHLRSGKRPRPLVLRVNEGNCLEIRFTNLLSESARSFPAGSSTLTQPTTRVAGLHIQGVNWLQGSWDDGSNVGENRGTPPNDPVLGSLVKPGETRTYRLFAEHEGSHLIYNPADDWTPLTGTFSFANGTTDQPRGGAGDGGTLTEGLFGVLTIQPSGFALVQRYEKLMKDISPTSREGARLRAQIGEKLPANWQSEWYRSQLTEQELCLASKDAIQDVWPCQRQDPGQLPEIDYQAAYPKSYPDASRHGLPILNMLRCAEGQWKDGTCWVGEIVHTDLTAVITGPRDGEIGPNPLTDQACPQTPDTPKRAFFFPPDPIPTSLGPGLKGVAKDPSLRPSYSYPQRCEPYREFTVVYQESYQVSQAFPYYYEKLGTLTSASDAFGINYGMQGLSTPILANRVGAGPLKDCTDCKYEEFFLQSWTQGDPDLIVDHPSTECVSTTDGSPQPCPTPTKNLYPDDPSNVYPSYMSDHLKFRILHAGPDLHHLHHQHAHQWIASPNTPDGDYLDSQSIGPGSAFTLEMVYNGSGNVNQTVGDSIFHCHFYPHFASGMWGLWRVLDAFEAGTTLDDCDDYPNCPVTDGTTLAGGNRAYPDAEIANGTSVPAVVPLPNLPMAPMPAPVRLKDNTFTGRRDVQVCLTDNLAADGSCNGTWTFATAAGDYSTEKKALNPGYPFFIPGIAGSRSPHPPLDFAWALSCKDKKPPHGRICEPPEEYSKRGHSKYLMADWKAGTDCECQPLDGGLPRNVWISGEATSLIEDALHSTPPKPLVDSDGTLSFLGQFVNIDFRREIESGTALALPETGTLVEQVAMATHATRTHATRTPEGVATKFVLNGLDPVPGAPYADPCIQFRPDGGVALGLPRSLPKIEDPAQQLTSRYLAVDMQLDAIFNKEGWHFPQQRIISLWGDVFPYLEGTKPPEPLFLRSNSYDCVEYVMANLVPNIYELDDFQVRTPTDVLGQHIHLVKFDVTSSDGAANGWNYEDGTFAPNEVTERIDALNHALWECKEDPECKDGTKGFIAADRESSIELHPKYIPFFGPGPVDGDTSWVGSQATIQRWYADPLLNNYGLCKGKAGGVAQCTSTDLRNCAAGATCDPSGGVCSNSPPPPAPPLPCVAASRADTTAMCGGDPNALCLPAHDRTIRTIFTHDHYSPSTHQQAGLYAGLVAEPKGSKWLLQSPQARNLPGGEKVLPPGTQMGGWDPTTGGLSPGLPVTNPNNGLVVYDGGPTSWESLIVGQGPKPVVDELSFREFLFQVQDTALMYEAFNGAREPLKIKSQVGICPVNANLPANVPNPVQACTTNGDCPQLPAGGCQPASLCSYGGPEGLKMSCGYDKDCQEMCGDGDDCAHSTCDTAGFCSNTGWCVNDQGQFQPGQNGATQQMCLMAPPGGEQAGLDKVSCDTAAGYSCQFILANLVGCTPKNLSQCASRQPPFGPDTQLHDVESCNYVPGIPYTTWAAGYPLDAPRGVEVITFDNATDNFSFNYRNEPLARRFAKTQNMAEVYSSKGIALEPVCSIYGAPCRCSDDPAKTCTQNSDCGSICNPYFPLTPGVQRGDPFTPLARAYPGDDVQFRTLVGAHINPHNFTVHGINWPFEPSYVDSGWRNSEVMGISEHFEFLFKVPAIYYKPADAAAEAPDARPWSDFLYQPGAAAIEQSSGVWGLLRAYKEKRKELPTLPQNEGPFETAYVCPKDAHVQKYDAVAVAKELVYNNDLGIKDTNGLVFVEGTTCDTEWDGKPLVLRAAAGDCIQVTLRNCLEESTPSGVSFTPAATNTYSGGTAVNQQTSKVSKHVGLRPQLVSYNVRNSDGTDVGFNPADQIVPPKTNGTVHQTTYTWYAGNFHPGTAEEKKYRAEGKAAAIWAGEKDSHIPIEFGAANLLPPDPLNHYQHGLFGGLIIEPLSTRQDDSGNVQCAGEWKPCPDCGWKSDPDDQTVAVVTYLDEAYGCKQKYFREFVLFQQDDLQFATSQVSPGRPANGINYKSEFIRSPLTECFGGAPANFGVACTLAVNPATPTFKACAGEEVRMRLLHPGGTNTNEVFELFGHTFSEAPYMTRPEGNSCEAKLMHVNLASSQVIGSQNLCGSSDWLLDDPPLGHFPWDESLNEWKGSRIGQGPTNHFDVVIESAGGACQRPGDYLYRSYSIDHFNLGMWGIFRVGDEKKSPEGLECQAVKRPPFCGS